MKTFKFTISGNKYEVTVNEVDDHVAEIEVNGTNYTVEIEREVKKAKTPILVRKEVERKPWEGAVQKQNLAGYPVKAPLPGVIVKINIKQGDTVKKGDVLCVMEAMKMENNILAEKDGEVKNIRVNLGDNVLQGDILLEM